MNKPAMVYFSNAVFQAHPGRFDNT